MPEAPAPPVIAIVGPTASGKTAVAEALGVGLGGEIVTADSMQVYRGMDIGTAKVPSKARRVPHHLIDMVDPGEPYSAALYQVDARSVIDEMRTRAVRPILAGGTGLYVRAALDEMEFPFGDTLSETRSRLEREAEQLGAQALHDRLAATDPESAALIHPNNVRRTIRALEMAEQGTPYAEQASGFAERSQHYPSVQVGLEVDREVLYRRIDSRVAQMLEAGLLDEVRGLLDAGFRDALTSAQAIGYKEFVPVVEGDADVETAADQVRQATRRYAKRQLTWFRGDPRVRWLDVTEMSPEQAAAGALALIESESPDTPAST
jgi:tRNA dimethylallyltransferase